MYFKVTLTTCGALKVFFTTFYNLLRLAPVLPRVVLLEKLLGKLSSEILKKRKKFMSENPPSSNEKNPQFTVRVSRTTI